MAFIQRNLVKPKDISMEFAFDVYRYRTDDPIEEVTSEGYFDRNTFGISDGDLIQTQTSSGYYELFYSPAGAVFTAQYEDVLRAAGAAGAAITGGPFALTDVGLPAFGSPDPEITLPAPVADPDITQPLEIPGSVWVGREDYSEMQLQGADPSFIVSNGAYRLAASDTPSAEPISRVYSCYYAGQLFEVAYRDVNNFGFHILIDGEYFAELQATNANAARRVLVDTGRQGLKRIDIVFPGVGFWGGLHIESGFPIIATRDDQPHLSVLGDSFTAGTNATFNNVWCNSFHRKLNTFNVTNYGAGGSGYVPDGQLPNGQFIKRLPAIIARNPDLLIVAGGENDKSEPEQTVFDAIDAFYAEIISLGYDGSKVVALGPWTQGTVSQSSFTYRMAQYIKGAVESIGGRFIDNVKDGDNGWIYGTGNADSPTGDGNADLYATSVGDVHPTPDGHTFLGDCASRELLGVLPR